MDDIAARAAKGDHEAMADVVRQHYAAVYRFCVRRVGLELGQDAAQETFVTAQRSMKRFDGRSPLSTWLIGIAHNHCRNLSRKHRLEISWPECEPMEKLHANVATEKRLIDMHTLRQALKKLSPEHREVVLLHEIEGLSYDEAAEILGVPSGTVKSRLHHAFQNLRKSMSGCSEVTA